MRVLSLFTLIFVFSIVDTTLLSLGKVDPRVVEYFGFTNLTIFLFQILVLIVARKLIRNRTFFFLIIAAITAVNILAFKLAYHEFFLHMRDITQFIILVLVITGLFQLFKRIEESNSFYRSSSVIILFLILVPVLNFWNDFDSDGVEINTEDVRWSGSHRNLANKIIDVEFTKKPNIHIITFDSLMPKALVEKFFSLDGWPSYNDTIKENNGIVFKNSFAMQVPTRNSWSSFLMLDQTEFDVDHKRFSGIKDSLLFNIFRSNGYKVLTGYPGSYFGTLKGEYVDIYDTYANESGISDSIYCLISDKSADNTVAYFIPKHYAACKSPIYNLHREYFVKDIKKPLFDPGQELHLTYDLQMGFQDKTVKTIKELTRSGEPWITAHHFQTIGHVGSSFITYDDYELEKYADNYKKKSLIVSKYIEKILDAAGEEAIVIIMGDHGSWISKSLSSSQLSEEQRKFFVQDRHGVLNALFGQHNACKEGFKAYYSTKENEKNISRPVNYPSLDPVIGFTSSGRVMAGVIRCLTNKPATFDKAINFTNDLNFQKFLYE